MLSSKFLIIGAGQTGLHLAKELSLLGENVVLIEQDAFGGSYLHSLDIPKFWLKHEARSFGFALEIFKDYQTTFQTLLNYRKSIKSLLQEKIMATYRYFLEDYENTPNLHIIAGKASFSSKNLIEIHNSGVTEFITFEHLILCVGKNSLITPSFLKNKNIQFLHQYSAFEFSKIPNSILIIGLNPDNLEIADLYSNLGIKVTIVEEKSIYEAIPALDSESITYLEKHLENRQIQCHFETNILEIIQTKKITIQAQEGQKLWIKDFEAVYIQVQETFVDKGLGLNRAGIEFDINGIHTDNRCRTNTANIWALGECNSKINKSNKLGRSTDFVFNVRRQNSNTRLWDMVGISELSGLSNNHMHLEIKISKPIFVLGLSLQQAESIYNPDIESEMIQKIDQEGFCKIWFRPSSGQIIGSTLVGEMSQYRHYINASISRNINGIEVIRYIIGD
jgi:pyruvate/2-oxoglutarate dehydrogenase complex dihydrolipoamide dehydrogenase (E3) component